MDELFPLIFWLFAGLAGLIIKAAKGSKKQQTQQQQQQQRGPARQQPTAQARKPAPAAAKPQPPRPTPQPVQPHVNVPLEAHMHEPEMGEEGTGTEGIDCCHEYMLDQPAAANAEAAPLAPDNADRAQALLQGVIFSEILGRRPVRRFGGRHA